MQNKIYLKYTFLRLQKTLILTNAKLTFMSFVSLRAEVFYGEEMLKAFFAIMANYANDVSSKSVKAEAAERITKETLINLVARARA